MDYATFKQILSNKRIKLQDVADALGMTSNGLRKSIQAETMDLRRMKKMCEFLELSPMVFFGHEEEYQASEIKQLKEQIRLKDEIIALLKEKNNR